MNPQNRGYKLETPILAGGAAARPPQQRDILGSDTPSLTPWVAGISYGSISRPPWPPGPPSTGQGEIISGSASESNNYGGL